jgi:hypothetical protein
MTIHAGDHVSDELVRLDRQFLKQRGRRQVLGVGLVQQRKGPFPGLAPTPDQG